MAARLTHGETVGLGVCGISSLACVRRGALPDGSQKETYLALNPRRCPCDVLDITCKWSTTRLTPAMFCAAQGGAALVFVFDLARQRDRAIRNRCAHLAWRPHAVI